MVWPLLDEMELEGGIPFHSAPTHRLPPYYVQTAGLEILWTKTVQHTKSIAGINVLGYLLTGAAALDINTEEDWQEAERLIAAGVKLPDVA